MQQPNPRNVWSMMNSSASLLNRLASLAPGASPTRPREWLRISFGVALGLSLSLLLSLQLFPEQTLIHLLGPLAATAVLLFAVPSGALAQPWSVLVSYLGVSALAIVVQQQLGYSLLACALTLGLSALTMNVLRCLHPPAGALSLCVLLSDELIRQQGFLLLLPIFGTVTCLLVCALIYNNLTGVRYPKRAERTELHHTRDPLPDYRVGISDADLDQALEDFGEFVDITRDDLAQLIHATERHALKRGMGTLLAGQIMSRDLRWVSPEATREQALEMLRHHRLRSLPVLDALQQLVGILSLVDLVETAPRARLLRWRPGRSVKVAELMSSPVRHVDSQAHVAELIPLLSSQGLHCLPVLENGVLVGIITQTDLIAALQRDVLERLG